MWMNKEKVIVGKASKAATTTASTSIQHPESKTPLHASRTLAATVRARLRSDRTDGGYQIPTVEGVKMIIRLASTAAYCTTVLVHSNCS
jgi:hypothetical protein